MQNHEFKYKPLKDCDNDNEEANSPPDGSDEEVANPSQIHWSFKILFIVFLLTQVFYVIFESDLQYISGNNTKVPSSNCIGEECPETYGEFTTIDRGVVGDEVTKERILNKSTSLSPPTTEVYGNTETEDSSSFAEDSSSSAELYDYRQIPLKYYNINYYNNSLITNEDYSNYAETETTTTTTTMTTSSSVVKSNEEDLSNLINKIFEGTTRSVINNESTTKASTPVRNDLTTTTTVSITSIANYSTETPTTALPIAVAGVGSTFAIKQWAAVPTTKKTTTTSTIKKPPYEIKQKTQSQRKYFINTSRCHMPFVDPFTAEARKIFKPSHTTGCTKDNAIITSHYDELNMEYFLRINYTVAMQLDGNATAETIADDLRCCYRQIERSGSGATADAKFKLLPCTNFHQDFVVPPHVKGVIVDCTSKKSEKLLQQDAFSFIQVKQTDRKKSPPKPNAETNGRRNLGILLIGIDTLSRMNFRRTMPQTFKSLQDYGFYELKGYNKVGDNTFPNLIPLLTGYGAKTAYSKCNPRITGRLDNCNFIWTNMSEHGFVTAYAEDTPTMSTFNYNKKGFQKLPTDYYFRPIALALDKTMVIKMKAGLKYCTGRHQSGEYIYDYGMEFVKRFKNQSNFGLFWTNSFSHNAFDTAATMDTTMQHYLEDMQMQGIMETTVVLFFSDHGRRWGPLLKLQEGFLEERLPMFFISLPKWFKQEYPDLLRSLEVNQKRLATPFDIYMTLQHLLQLTAPTFKMRPAPDCAQAQSILQELPENRNCETACIPESWCTCIPYMTVSTKNDVVKKVTQLILKEMNNYLAAKNMSSACSELTLKGISKAFLRDVDNGSHTSSSIATYRIDFATKPNTKPVTEFSATADYDTMRQSVSINVEDIGRQSMYAQTAQCTDDKQLMKYCICKSSVKKSS